ncbi:MAG: DUF4215 domain-containing protein [Deltaproteobacteria bacterium]|nr:DUF4215 domain-containing protein [Deltaproteobacteria bacterium]
MARNFKYWATVIVVGLGFAAAGCAASSDDPGNGSPVCGNGKLESGEICDDGNTTGGDGCSARCLMERSLCGNGNVDPGEVCDDGNTAGGDGCSASCQREGMSLCGNSMVDTGEDCDDGNMSNTDNCLNTCRNPRCGDGNIRAGMEECDSGAANSNTAANACRLDCKAPKCGDGVRDTGSPLNETCDDGNTVSDDGCSDRCVREPRCGDMVVDAPAENCDDGNRADGDGCSMACRKEPRCGDGEVQTPGESCDDGNTMAGDGCNATCAAEPGHVFELEPNDAFGTATPLVSINNQAHGSISPGSDGDYYSFVLAAGGDIRIETFDGTGAPNCTSADTEIELYAPNGTTVLASDDDDGVGNCSLIDPAGAFPDPGAAGLVAGTYFVKVMHYSGSTVIPGYRLQITALTQCGNGVREGGEQCDGGAGCSTSCRFVPVCGNRRLEDTEQCDDGNMGAGDGCSATCQYEVVNEVEPNNAFGTATSVGNPDKLTRGAFMPAADEDFWKFHLDARSDVLIETFDEMGPGKCATMDTVIELRGMDGTTIITSDDDGGVGACSLIDPATNTLARGLARGDYYVRVRLYSTTSTAAAYHLRVRVVAQCGNNVRESTEMCDDGNTTDGDGCQSTCTLPSVLETEPNDDGAVSSGGGSTTGNDFSSAMAGTPITADRLIDAKLMPAGDEDVFAIRNTTGAARSITVSTLGPAQCGSMDTYLHIRDMAGASLASDDDSGDGNCSTVTYSVPAMTTVFAHVFEYGDDAVIAAYQVYIQFN